MHGRTLSSTIGSGLLALALAGGCAHHEAAPPVATIALTPSKTRVALGSPIDMTYTITVAPNAKFDGDYHVFVHVDEADTGTTIWNDDHDPPTPTSKWTPGQTITYTRTTFLPVFPYVGAAVVHVGLYRGKERLPVTGGTDPDRAATAATLEILPQSDNIALWYKSGWNPAEFAPDDPALAWQWTQKSALVSFRNPKKDATLFLEYDARADLFTPPQQLTISVDGHPVTQFAADSLIRVLRRIPIPAAAFGAGDTSELSLDVDRAFVPAQVPAARSRDARELGIRVYHLFLDVR